MELPTFGRLLRQCRLAAGLTQEGLAERARLSVRGIADLERGARRFPHAETVDRLAEALDLPEAQHAALLAASRRAVPVERPSGGPSGTEGSPFPASVLVEHAGPPVPLPVIVGELLGRQQEQAEARARLGEGVRLLTLTGPGGVGKTRLAVAIADDVAGDLYAGGVRFADLTPLRDSTLVAAAIARAFGLALDGSRELAQVLGPALQGRPCLLVLDNCEQVLAGAREIGPVLDAVPELVVLATSREPLRLRAEQELPVRPLPVPHLVPGASLADLASNPAAQLFAQRARAVDPSFQLTDANVRAVAQLCARLDGLPLAIEVAAARARLLPPQAMVQRLGQHMDLDLEARAVDVPVRQRTLRATLAWSHDLLTEEERALFRRLAVFAGGWTLEAAEAVCSGAGLGAGQVLGLLGRLLDKSLVVAEDHAGERRYRFLQPVREYALEQLADSPEHETVERQHGEWCIALAEEAEGGRPGLYRVDRLPAFELEHDNAREALHRFIQHRDAERGLRLGTAMYWFWYHRGYFGEGRAWLAQVLELPGASGLPAARATALSYLGQLAYCQGAFAEADARLEASRAVFQGLGGQRGVAWALLLLGNSARGRGDLIRARRLYEETRCLERELGNLPTDATTLYVLAETLSELGEPERADALARDALGRFRERHHLWGTARSLEVLGRVAARRGDHATARGLLEEALDLQRQIGDVQGQVVSLITLAQCADEQGELDRARGLAHEALRLAWDSGNLVGVARALEGLGLTLAVEQPVRAVQLWSASAALRARLGATPYPAEGARVVHELEQVRVRLGEAAYCAAWTVGQATSIGRIVAGTTPPG